ncbi:hypothetical protein PAXINDRAFT_156661 [Paxillus involutus ATCC 200175]|uniref:Uncharacterized protein n=1 Tax=Paxillus involutus ATCC 200175 TaxID=664439 RepID=A0A0C9SV04_PAXIN|nr:hypothetical protein PAXINDRAFT_156661 [Paxillus involutus ATCC 200175]
MTGRDGGQRKEQPQTELNICRCHVIICSRTYPKGLNPTAAIAEIKPKPAADLAVSLGRTVDSGAFYQALIDHLSRRCKPVVHNVPSLLARTAVAALRWNMMHRYYELRITRIVLVREAQLSDKLPHGLIWHDSNDKVRSAFQEYAFIVMDMAGKAQRTSSTVNLSPAALTAKVARITIVPVRAYDTLALKENPLLHDTGILFTENVGQPLTKYQPDLAGT